MHRLLIIVMLGVIATLMGCDKQSSSTPSDSVIAGEALFMENCAKCHPRTGRGDYLKRIPATMLTRRSQFELMAWIEGKDQHREMPSFGHLNDDERAALADYLFTEIMK